MELYINKEDIVKEIKKRSKIYGYGSSLEAVYKKQECDDILSFLDTLETKDVNEMIKTAEDHAYFAGSENTREKLIDKACKWLRIELVNFEDYIGMGETFIEDFKTYMKGE